MRRGIILLCWLAACRAPEEKPGIAEQVRGDWFIVYPREGKLTEKAEALYARIQDSLLDEKALKGVSFHPDSRFQQLDTSAGGRWGLGQPDKIVITGGGEGFENFRGQFISAGDGWLKLAETIRLEGEEIYLTWYLRKMDWAEKLTLFSPVANQWRQPPAAPETDKAIRLRLADMLRYYAAYFRLIAEESSYFMPQRIHLPVKFYQHAIGVMELDYRPAFRKYFFNEEQARLAVDLLKKALKSGSFSIRSSDSYSAEYAQMLRILANRLDY